MPPREGTTTRTFSVSSAITAGGALTIALGAIVGIASDNPVLAVISLSIGAGGVLGWLLAGSPALNRRSRP
jgi:hypothetical protein